MTLLSLIKILALLFAWFLITWSCYDEIMIYFQTNQIREPNRYHKVIIFISSPFVVSSALFYLLPKFVVRLMTGLLKRL